MRAVAVPVDVDQPRRLLAHQALGVGAVGAVHRHAATAGDEADDVVAGHRRAAPRQADEDVVETLDVDADGAIAGGAADRAGWARRPRTARHRCPARTRGPPSARSTVPRRGARRSPPAPSRGRRTSWPRSRWRATLLSQMRCNGRPSRRNSLVSSSRPASIMSTRRSRLNHCRILLRARGDATNCNQSRDGAADSQLGGEDLARVAAVQRGTERHEPSVDLGADAVVPDLGVHRVGEVDAGRADRQRDDPPLRREHEDLVLFEVGLQVLHERRRVGDVGLPVDDAVQPVDVAASATSSLYDQCAATPHSARWCISCDRICTSTTLPPGPMTVVCRLW